MKGKELVKAIQNTKGPLYVEANMDGFPWVEVVREDVIDYFTLLNNTETDCIVCMEDDRQYIKWWGEHEPQ